MSPAQDGFRRAQWGRFVIIVWGLLWSELVQARPSAAAKAAKTRHDAAIVDAEGVAMRHPASDLTVDNPAVGRHPQLVRHAKQFGAGAAVQTMVRRHPPKSDVSEQKQRGVVHSSEPDTTDVGALVEDIQEGEQEEEDATLPGGWPSLLELKNLGSPGGGGAGGGESDGWRRRGGARRRRGVSSIIGDFPMDLDMGAAKTGVWRPAFVISGEHKALHLDNPSGLLLDQKRALKRYNSNNSWLELPQVAPKLTAPRMAAYSIMFDFKLIRKSVDTQGHMLLEFSSPEHAGLPFRSSGIGFEISKGNDLVFKGTNEVLKRDIKQNWTHIGVTANNPCGDDSILKVYVDGELKINWNETQANDKWKICTMQPFFNFHCWNWGKDCSARLEVLLDNLWTIEDYVTLHDAGHATQILASGSKDSAATAAERQSKLEGATADTKSAAVHCQSRLTFCIVGAASAAVMAIVA